MVEAVWTRWARKRSILHVFARQGVPFVPGRYRVAPLRQPNRAEWATEGPAYWLDSAISELAAVARMVHHLQGPDDDESWVLWIRRPSPSK